MSMRMPRRYHASCAENAAATKQGIKLKLAWLGFVPRSLPNQWNVTILRRRLMIIFILVSLWWLRSSNNVDRILSYPHIKPVPFAWESSEVLPIWMKEYFEWHHKQRQILNRDNWKEFRFFIMRCLDDDIACGGASDRLQQLPLLVRYAYDCDRILLIYWERPAPLETYLVPPRGGVDWRVPAWLSDALQFSAVAKVLDATIPDRLDGSTIFLDKLGHAGGDQGQELYDVDIDENNDTFSFIYHDVWNVFFEPAPPVAALIRENLENMELASNQFTSVHIRAEYVQDESQHMSSIVANALDCAHSLNNASTTFYIASDSDTFSQAAIEYGQSQGWYVATRKYERPPLHIDTATSDHLQWELANQELPRQAHAPPEYFYDTFVDLYLLSLGECMSFGAGGYGMFANRLSANVSCVAKYGSKDFGASNLGGGCHKLHYTAKLENRENLERIGFWKRISSWGKL